MAVNYLDQYTAETVPAFTECVVFSGERVLFTPTGIRRYRERFARAGFDIARIDTAEQLQAALEGSWHIELQGIEQNSRRQRRPEDAHEWALLDAVRSGSNAEVARLSRALERRNRLRVVR